jgi:hypothetical protein
MLAPASSGRVHVILHQRLAGAVGVQRAQAGEIRRVRPAIVTGAVDRLPRTDLKRKARGNLKHAFDVAVYHEAIPGNPAEKTPAIAKLKRPVQTIHIDDIEVIREKVREWSVGANRPGPKNHDMPDLVDRRPNCWHRGRRRPDSDHQSRAVKLRGAARRPPSPRCECGHGNT